MGIQSTTSKFGLVRSAFLLLLIVITAACSTQVTVDNSFPTPLLRPEPLKLGVFYTEGFDSYTYEEERGGSDYSIAFGDAHRAMFDRLLPAMFVRSDRLTSPDITGSEELDALLKVRVVDVQFTLPRESMGKTFEVWIKYGFELQRPDGESVATWSVPGYGKSVSATMKSTGKALSEAAYVAVRDAGTHFVIKFKRNKQLQDFLALKKTQQG